MQSRLRAMVTLTVVALVQTVTFAAPAKVTFEDHVKPIFRQHCFSCHNADKARADLDVSTFSGIMAGSSSGQVVAAGDPDGSKLLKVMTHAAEPKMPPKQPRLPDKELDIVKQWIAGGLLETAGSQAKAGKPKMDLSLQSAPTGKPAQPLPLPKELLLDPLVRSAKDTAITAIASSPWSPVIAVGSQKQVLLYHSDTLDLLGVLPFPEGFPYVIKFSRTGSLVLAGGGRGGKSGRVVVWEVASGKRVIEVGDETDAVLAADISADQSLIALAGPGKLVKIYSTKDGDLMHSIKKHTDWVYALEFSPDGVLLASGDRNGGLFVWESLTGREFYALRGHTAAITDISWRIDSNIVASISEDTTIRLWEMQNGTQAKGWGAHGGGGLSVQFTHDGRLVSTGRDRVTKIWDGNGAQQRAFDAHNDVALKTTFSHDGSRVFAGDWTGEIRAWTSADGKRVGAVTANPPTLAERTTAAEQRLAALQASLPKLNEAHNGAKAAADKAAADLAAVQKLANDSQGLVKTYEAQAATAKAQGDQSKANLAATTASATRVQGSVKTWTDVFNTNKASQDQLQLSLKAIQAAVSAKEAELKPLADAAAKAKDASTKAPKDANLANVAKQTADALTKPTGELTTMKATLDKTAQSAKTSAESMAMAKAELDKFAAELAGLQKQMADLTAANKTQEAAYATAVAGLTKAKGDFDAASKLLPGATAAAKAASDAYAKAKGDFDAANGALAAAKTELDRVRTAKVTSTIYLARDALTTKQNKFEELSANLKGAQLAADKAVMAVANTQKKIAEAPAQLAAKTAEVEKAKAAAVAAVTNVNNANKVVADQEALAKPLADAYAKLKEAAEKQKQVPALAVAAAKAKEGLDALAPGITAAKTNAANLQTAANAALAVQQQAEQLVAQFKAEVDAMSKRMPQLQAAIKETADKVVVAKQATDAFAKELGAAKADFDRLVADLTKNQQAKAN